MKCPLCEQLSSPMTTLQIQDRVERYWSCSVCALVFLDPKLLPSLKIEKKTYDQHENSPEHLGYVRFLEQLTNPLSKVLPPQAQGLDYGSGPGPTLCVLMENQGFRVENYDPIYQPQFQWAKASFDFITCTEVFEHFHCPKKEMNRLASLLKKDGILGILTQVLDDEIIFEKWWYVRDPTHVSFYRPQTLEWIAQNWNWKLYSPSRNVFLFSKSELPIKNLQY